MLRLLFDNNISYRIKPKVKDAFPNPMHVTDTDLPVPAADEDIWEWAKINGYVIVSQDDDFSTLSSVYGFPPKVIHLRIGNQSTQFIANLLIASKETIEAFYENTTDGVLEILY